MRYIKGTLDYKLVYKRTEDPEPFLTYSDADHGGDVDNGRSTGGYLVICAGAAISWARKLQSIVALSSTEAQDIAAVEAGKEIMWMCNMLTEFGIGFSHPSSFFVDNNSAIQVSHNPEYYRRIKHLDLQMFWLRHAVEQGNLDVYHIATSEMSADMLKKALSKEKVVKFQAIMGLVV